MIILKMARCAIFWRADKEFIGVTLRTKHSYMLASQLECGAIMIECGRGPSVRRVTGGTVRAKLAAVRVILEMAGGAIRRRAFEDAIDMTSLAGNCGMLTIEVECEF